MNEPEISSSEETVDDPDAKQPTVETINAPRNITSASSSDPSNASKWGETPSEADDSAQEKPKKITPDIGGTIKEEGEGSLVDNFGILPTTAESMQTAPEDGDEMAEEEIAAPINEDDEEEEREGEDEEEAEVEEGEAEDVEEEDVEQEEEGEGDNTIDISRLVITVPQEARRIAEIILDVLEQDLQEMKRTGKLDPDKRLDNPEKEKARRRKMIKAHQSRFSLVSNFSSMDLDLNPDQPSTMELFVEKEVGPDRPYLLGAKTMVDASTQVDFHRDKKSSSADAGGPIDDFTQTQEFTMLRRDIAKREFTKFYPKPDDWKKGPQPASRDTSLQTMLDLADQYQEQDDLVKVGPKPKYKRPLKERLLKPLPADYQKTESYWTGSTFKGDFKGKLFHLGHYDYPTLAKYESEFKEGHIHSKKHFGIVTYPRGDTFEGTWRKGRFTDGQITFGDGLKFEPMGWRYCTAPDRRFFIEKTHGVQGVGESFYSDRLPPPHIPYNCYDVGDGVYNPETGNVINYEGVLLRKATEYEHRWIVLNCRKRKPLSECYEPCFMEERTPDHYANIYPPNT